MNREEFKAEIEEVLKPFAGTDTMYDRDNIVVCWLYDTKARIALMHHVDKMGYFVHPLTAINLIVCKTPYEPQDFGNSKKEAPLLKEEKPFSSIQVFDAEEVVFNDPRIERIENAIDALKMAQKDFQQLDNDPMANHTLHRLLRIETELKKPEFAS